MSVKYGFVAQNVVDEGRTGWDAINEIRKWVKDRQDLPKYTNEQIVCFLIACDNEIEATKTTIAAFHTLRNRIPEVFTNRDLNDPSLKTTVNAVNFCILPKLTEDGYVIIYTTFVDSNYLSFDCAGHMKMSYMVLEAAIYDYAPNGLILIADMTGAGVMHLTRLKLGLMRLSAQYLQTGLPVKLINVHLLNTPWFIGKFFAIVKPMMSDKVFNLIVCHTKGEMETFSENHIAKEYLPLELGGELPSMEVMNKETQEKLRSMQSHFDAEEKQRKELSNNTQTD